MQDWQIKSCKTRSKQRSMQEWQSGNLKHNEAQRACTESTHKGVS